MAPNPTSPAGGNASPGGHKSSPKGKQSAALDFKALQLESEFKSKHFGVLGVLTWIL
jgi:phosphatidylinositol glycan class O